MKTLINLIIILAVIGLAYIGWNVVVAVAPTLLYIGMGLYYLVETYPIYFLLGAIILWTLLVLPILIKEHRHH